ncbi:leucine-rich repeat receptor-like protein kinase PEPR1 [Cornus florida]|uniref:leucine-rich repeat receptor-like protein kinase PEPR1 n=1 Tax=Cornus florida TaxID=4283 RepID=UPI0028975795|nr:leucine-rich repeat receptor-like protein kinase PEPR1 [Cornus florida]
MCVNSASLNLMAKPMQSISSCLYSIIIFTFISGFVHSITLQSDIEALRSLKQAIDPISIPRFSFLHSWNFHVDPCQSSGGNFLGILCSFPPDNTRSRITSLDLDAGGYDGFLTSAIGNLTELTTINLSKNRFRGPIPDTISNLKMLTRLSLSENFFTGGLPTRISTLKMLQIVDVSYNNLSGLIPAAISGIRSLTQLRMSNNGFTGRIPNLNGLWQLNTLELSSNQLFGYLPQLPTSLRTLSLSHNILSGGVSTLRQLKRLQVLDLSQNRFSGFIDQAILNLPEVNHINVSVNRFTSIAVIKISGGGSQLRVLDGHSNNLRGHLPVNLVTYANLTAINLGHNQFSGQIPPDYGRKLGQSWRSLFLDYNFLVGSLPTQFNLLAVRIRGSLAKNCLSCPRNILLCSGGQRSASECVGQNHGSR